MRVGGQRHVPTAVSPADRPGAHFTQGWDGPKPRLDRRGNTCALRDSIPERPARNKSVYQPHIPAHKVKNEWHYTCTPPYAFRAWKEISFVHTSASRNPNKGNLHNHSFKQMKIIDLFLCHRTKDGNTEHVGATLKFHNCIWDSLVRTFAFTPFIQTKFPWFRLVLPEKWRESVSITTDHFDNFSNSSFAIHRTIDFALSEMLAAS